MPLAPDDRGVVTAAMAVLAATLCAADEVAVTVMPTTGRPAALVIPVRGDASLREVVAASELAAGTALTADDVSSSQPQLVIEFGSHDEVPAQTSELTARVSDTSVVLDGPAELFDQPTFTRLGGLLAQVIGAFRSGWDVRVADVELMTDADLRLVSGAWIDTRAPLPELSVVAAVRQVATVKPQAVAVRDVTTSRSYQELIAEMTSLAQRLRAAGAGPGELVAVSLPRTAALPTALLAVMSTGAAYVPIDPDYPPDRVAMMLEDSHCRVMVTTSETATALHAERCGIAVVDVAATGPAALPVKIDRTTADDADPTDPPLSAPAYVIYTSGSTGRPKGVVVPHLALMNFLQSMQQRPGFGPGDVLLAVTTVSFDIAGLELFLPLLAGGTLVVADRATCLDPARLAAALDRYAVTVMQATPATWRMLVDAGWAGRAELRALCGGEALPQPLAAALLTRARELWNLYGPTETTIWSTLSRVTAADETPSIGRPIHNTDVAVVDRSGRLVPIGVAGELLIGGAGLADGYLGRPDLTAERFVPHPLDPSRRAYRTGDLVRWRTDGSLSYLGRLDHQVKVHGYRIELGEVEAALLRHVAVKECVAVAQDLGDGGDRRLVAYVVLRAGQSASATELRRSVTDILPSYMVPSVVIELPVMPRTPNGKLDRTRLPTVAADHRAEMTRVDPRDELERRLLTVWRTVLGIDGIGVTDDFFALGVSSLTAARLFARIEAEFGRRLPLEAVFTAPTVEAFAELLRHEATTSAWRSLVPIQPGGSQRPIFGVHGGAGTVLLYAELSRRLGDDQPFFGLQAVGLYGREAPQTSVEAMAATYIAEMQQVQPRGPYRLAGYCFGALVAFEMARQLSRGGAAVEIVVALNGPAPGYLRRYRAVFDAEGAVFDAEGRRQLRPRSARGALPATSRDALKVLALPLRRRAYRAGATARLRWSLVSGRPLPEALREGSWFQRLAAQAQAAYEPPPGDVPMLVVRVPHLYYEDDLGWREYNTGPLTCLEVAGSTQTVPRHSMREPSVAVIADGLTALLADSAR